jgi:hypothetical protein
MNAEQNNLPHGIINNYRTRKKSVIALASKKRSFRNEQAESIFLYALFDH